MSVAQAGAAGADERLIGTERALHGAAQAAPGLGHCFRAMGTAKIRTELLEPIHLDPDPDEADDQASVDRLAKRRSFPLFG
jgi:hypothetical protein